MSTLTARLRELETLFAAQWLRRSRMPHIVFNRNATAADYFPNPGWWASQRFSPPAPDEHQPPVDSSNHGARYRRLARRPDRQVMGCASGSACSTRN